MKLVRFGEGEIGAVEGDRIVALDGIATGMAELLAFWPARASAAAEMVRAARRAVPLKATRLLAPIARPGKILAIGLNYADHIAETGREKPQHQTWFAKMPTAVNGPHDPIVIPAGCTTVDYEAELVAVIGRGGRRISREDAPNHVAGYCCGNDVTERSWQQRSSQWIVGKSCDTHAPVGPWITTADEIPDPHALAIRCLVNGETRQESNTRHLVFDLWDQIAHVSAAMTLEPGDLIFTGTPGGVGMAMKPPRFLKPGDTVRVEIDGLGALEAKMVAEDA
ncbi:MAG TPA: fumarylacetoacetate hydrolase family protein [Rhizomicrobium sp.]|nr:fumarylacetoacetate hydrolase family protein [Rhizomicrobium sp.]